MFTGFFKQKSKQTKQEAEKLYSAALANVRQEIFYTKYGVPDTFDGRFDLLLLHIFIILQRTMNQDNYKELSQDLFDTMFKDMDQTLREMGIGDMGIPKHMKRMMQGFNGRMHAYHDALCSPDKLKEVIARNLYAMDLGSKELDKTGLDAVCAFVSRNLYCDNNIGEFIMLDLEDKG